MIIGSSYARLYATTQSQRSNDANAVKQVATDNSKYQDQVSLSDAARAMLRGEQTSSDQSLTYSKQEQREKLVASNTEQTTQSRSESPVISSFMSTMLDQMLHQKLGVDKDKLKEIEAMMEQVGGNENLSEEERQQILQSLEQMREELIQQGNQRQMATNMEQQEKDRVDSWS